MRIRQNPNVQEVKSVKSIWAKLKKSKRVKKTSTSFSENDAILTTRNLKRTRKKPKNLKTNKLNPKKMTNKVRFWSTVRSLDYLSNFIRNWWHFKYQIWDICRRNSDLCKQQPNLAPIQSKDEGVSCKIQISWRQPIEKNVQIQNKNNYK